MLVFCAMPFPYAVAERPAVVSPLSPQQSLQHIEMAPGLLVELVAHEPLIVDPVALRFDEDGRLWVVEMRDYPHGPPAGEPARSRISVLTDKDGDGFFESGSVFVDELLFATGLQPWKGGVFVTMAGQVAYMKDTTGNGKADLIETWYTGFAEENPQLRANHPRLGLDNRIYVANGLRGGEIVAVQQQDSQPLSISGMDFRFDPRSQEFEAVSGAGQFGMTFDDFGNRFVCSNRNPVMHIVMENEYLTKNPLVSVPTVRHDVATAGAASRVFPITRSWTTSNLHAGQFTAACGVLVYRGDLLPHDYHGNAFTCDPTGHLVHREVMHPHGVTFTSQPAREGKEFFASRDEWCSPVNLELGPDGALYVVDMYRAVIEHPDWMPEELRDRLDLHLGNEHGRIYRIRSQVTDHSRSTPELSTAKNTELVQYLSHPNAWWRETASRLLLERDEASVHESLRKVVREQRSSLARIHALWLLQGLRLLNEQLLFEASNDEDPRVLEQVVALSEPYVQSKGRLRDKIKSFCQHDDARIRYRALLALAPVSLVFSDFVDEWEMRAALIAVGTRAGEVLAETLRNAAENPTEKTNRAGDHAEWTMQLVSLAASTNDETQRLDAASVLLAESSSRAAVIRFLHELTRHGISVTSFRDKLKADEQRALDQLFAEAHDAAASQEATTDERIEAIGCLSLDRTARTSKVLTELAMHEADPELRSVAIDALAGRTDLFPWEQLLAEFSTESPQIRRRVLSGVLRSKDRIELLMEQIARGRIASSELESHQVNQLVQHRDSQIKARATELLAAAVPQDRQQVLAEYRSVLNMSADAQRGKQIFKKHCAVCHRIDDVGVDVAPDISDSRVRSGEQYLTDILQPNRAIDANYVDYSLVTEDGRIFRGIIATETATSVTLKQPEGKTYTFRRDEIEELRSSGTSLMPEGMEKQISHQDMADLIAFIKNWRYLDGRTPLRGSSR